MNEQPPQAAVGEAEIGRDREEGMNEQPPQAAVARPKSAETARKA